MSGRRSDVRLNGRAGARNGAATARRDARASAALPPVASNVEAGPEPDRARPSPRRWLVGAGVGAASLSLFGAAARLKGAAMPIAALGADQALIAAGVAAAIGSAGFAGVMMARDNSHPLFGGIEHLMIFAQPIGGSRAAPPRKAAPVDYGATGSIGPKPPPAGAARPDSVDDATRERRAPPGAYVLRFARKGAVVVEGPAGSYAAAPGVVLPGAGKILAIENRNGRWLVATEKGVIAEMSRRD